MDMYTQLYLQWITNRTSCIAHGTLLSVTWQPGWEGSLGENGYLYMYMAESLHCSPQLSQHCLSAIFQYKIKSLKYIYSNLLIFIVIVSNIDFTIHYTLFPWP